MKFDLVFEGGGAKGMVFVGALQELAARGHTFGRLLGTSAGAITATGLAAGYSADELLAILNEKEGDAPVFASFMGAPRPFIGAEILNSGTLQVLKEIDIPLVPDRIEERAENWLVGVLMERFPNLFSLVERGGWYSADNFLTWLARILDSGIYPGPGPFAGKPRAFSKMTMAEFHAATERELSVIAADTSSSRMLVLNHRTAPQLPVVWAVRMSMSIPMVWPEVVWQPEWGPYLGHDLADHLLVDGGLLSNFPIELFISDDQHVTRVMGPKQDAEILGLLIDENIPVATAKPEKSGQASRRF
jgi:NTE family protein